MKARRSGNGLKLTVQAPEVELLSVLFDELDTLLEADDGSDQVVRRLYPAGYGDDAEASAEFADLVHDSLREERIARLGSCRADLPAGGGKVVLDAEACDRWIRVLNDLRLSLGTKLDVSETEDLDPNDPASAVYYWLSAAQEMLVGALM